MLIASRMQSLPRGPAACRRSHRSRRRWSWRAEGAAEAGHDLDAFLKRTRIELVPVTAEQANAARQAWRRFGKGNHPAALNFGDCFAYALAAVTGEPLLFKGEDFALTDIEAA